MKLLLQLVLLVLTFLWVEQHALYRPPDAGVDVATRPWLIDQHGTIRTDDPPQGCVIRGEVVTCADRRIGVLK